MVVDSRRAVPEEVADIRKPLEAGMISDSRIVELGEIVMGRRVVEEGRGITLFKSVGLAIQDVIAASLAYRKALELQIGIRIEVDL